MGGLILHQGQDQGSGLFVAIQYYHEVTWFFDAGAAPEPIENLSEQQLSEVFQVWLVRQKVHQPEPVLSPIAIPEEEYGKQVEKWSMQLKHPTFLAETRLGTDNLGSKLQFLNTRGENTIALPAFWDDPQSCTSAQFFSGAREHQRKNLG